jgi:hypothetical protein
MTVPLVSAPALRRGALAMAALAAMSIAACSTQPPEPQVATTARATSPRAAASKSVNPQLAIPVASGTYRCDENARVDVTPDARDATRIDVDWQGQRYTLTRHNSYSGLPRYEDSVSKLVWVVLPWKGLLLDGRSGQPLANECKPG